MSNSLQSQSNRWPAFIVTIAVAVLTILDTAKVNVTIAPIEETLGANSSQTQLIVAGYVLAFGIMLVPAGRLGDIWNRKAMFIIGLVVFAAASLYCMLAPDSTQLVIARIIQGSAAGILMPQVIGLIQNLFQGNERGQAFGIFGASIGIGTAFGPTIGGLFINTLGNELGWRWTFGMNVPLALIVLPFAIWLLPGRQKHRQDSDLDLPGVVLLASTVLFVMLPFVLTSGGDSDNPARWWLLLVAAVLAAAFVWWEKRYVAAGKSPVIDFDLFKLSSYRNGVFITTAYFAVMPPMFFVMTLFNQQGLGHSAVVVGMITIPFALMSALAAALTGRYTHKYAASMVFWGLVLFLGAMVAMAVIAMFVAPEHNPLWMAVALGIGGIGPGMVMSANQMRTLSRVPVESAGVGGSFMQVGQRLGNAMGIAIATSIFFSVIVSLPMPGGAPDRSNPDTIPTYQDAFLASTAYIVAVTLVAIFFAFLDLRSDRAEKAGAAAPTE